MIGIFRSRCAMAFAVVAGLLFALGWLLATAAIASFSGLESLATTKNLTIAGAWLFFVGAIAVLVGLTGALWTLLPARQWQLTWEVGVATIGAVILAIGFLLQALTALTTPEAANVVTAVGAGIWAILAAVVGARWVLADDASHFRSSHAPAWMIGATGLAVTAVMFGLPSGSVTDKGMAIANGIVGAVGFCTIAAGVGFAYARRLLPTAPVATVAGLVILAAGELTRTVVAGVVYGPTATLTGLRVGVSIATVIMAAGFVVLAGGSWERLRRLPPTLRFAPRTGAPPTETRYEPAPPPSQGLARFCSACGSPLAGGAHFCPQCGAAVASQYPENPGRAPEAS